MKKILFVFSGVCLMSLAQAQKTVPEVPPPPPVATEAPLPPPLLKAEHPFLSESDFLKRNKEVVSVHWRKRGHVMVLKFKNGKEESFDLTNEAVVDGAIKQFGGLPVAPPPPPPAPQKI